MTGTYNAYPTGGIADKFPKQIKPATGTSDGLLTSEDKCKLDALDLDDWNDRVYDIATHETDGLMSKEDKIKIDTVEKYANNYIHPDTENIRHVTDKEKAYWNAKASTALVTTTTNGLMSYTDKIKLDDIEENANNYIHPNTPLIRHVTDNQIDYWNNKASTALATQVSNGLMSKSDKKKLDEIEENANNYIHPDNPATRHVTDALIEYWGNKADKYVSTPTEDGLMSSKDKRKLDSITDTGEIIISLLLGETETTAYHGHKGKAVTDKVDSILLGETPVPKATDSDTVNGCNVETSVPLGAVFTDTTYGISTNTNDGLMSKFDRIKLNTIATNANNYTHPNDVNTRHVTDDQIKEWSEKASTTLVSTTSNGLMTKEDKTKLDGIAVNANNYTHPNDINTRHVSDAQISNWDNKAPNTLVTKTENGLMSKSDKNKLDDIEVGANNYIHPNDINTRHVTDAQIAAWDSVTGITTVSHTVNGLMTKEDKIKLDNLNTDDITFEYEIISQTVNEINSHQVTTLDYTLDKVDSKIIGSDKLSLPLDTTSPVYGSVVNGKMTVDLTEVNTILVRIDAADVQSIKSIADGNVYKIKAYSVEDGSNTIVVDDITGVITGSTVDVIAIDLKIVPLTGNILIGIEATTKTTNSLSLILEPRVVKAEMTLTEKLTSDIPATKIIENDDRKFVTQTQINEWSTKSIDSNSDILIRTATLSATEWDETEKSINVEFPELTTNSIGEVYLSDTCSKEEYDSVWLANLTLSNDSNGILTATYTGVKPTIDIPISIKITIKPE